MLCLKGRCTTLAADSSTSQWQARFWLPPTMTPGDYSLTVSNGFASGNMSTFIGTSAELKDLGSVTVKAPDDPRVAWPTAVFAAESHGCGGGFFAGRLNTSGRAAVGLDCASSGAPYNCPKNCSAAVQAAMGCKVIITHPCILSIHNH